MMHRLIIWSYFLLTLSGTTSSFKFVPNFDENLESQIKKHGYPVELYKITTEDDYILTIFRIPHGIHRNYSSTRSPVLLAPGLGVTASYFIALGKYRALPYYLADRGYDVWLLNTRGGSKSEGHRKYDWNKDVKYWDYSFHEVGIYDLTANIDFIIETTNQKPFVIGHSQGNTEYFIMCAEKPEYNDKVKIGVVYGPAIILHHIDIPIASVLISIVEIIQGVYRLFNWHEIYPFGRSSSTIVQFLSSVLCNERTYIRPFCVNIISAIGSHASKMLDEETINNILAGERSRFSARTLFHYMQISKYAKFGPFDFGPYTNLRIYGNRTAPLYDLSKITSPVAIFYAPHDDIVTMKGAMETIEKVPNVIYHSEVPFKDFNHIDFILGSNASTLVYEPTVQLMRAFDEGRLATNSRKKKGR